MVGLLLLFALHRLLAMPFLGGAIAASRSHQGIAFVVGLLSDAWLAGLSGLLFFLLLALPPLRIFGNAIAAGFLLLWGVAVALHQPYVEFFHFQFLPFHLRYLGDGAFIAANSPTLLNPRAFLLLAAAALLAWWLMKSAAMSRTSRIFAALVLCWAGAAAAHSANLHYRVQLFVPLELQTNFVERVFYHLKTPTTPEGYTAEERTQVATSIGLPSQASTDDVLFNEPRLAAPVDPLLADMRQGMMERMQAGRKPLVLVLLLESLRPAESGLYGNSTKTWTPFLDGLARESIWFQNAYSTSNVTRGGQEAAWCGYLSSATTSMMRGRPDVRLKCLPDTATPREGSDLDGESLWLHGGRRGFDDQAHFWRQHGVEYILSQEDFSRDAVRTDWGVSDRVFLARSLSELAEKRALSGKDFLQAMLLSVTNHIPWRIPADMPARMDIQGGYEPHWMTTRYTDEAVAEFVQGLRDSGLWDDTVLVVASDHGMIGATDPAVQAAPSPDEQLSHIFMMITGGVVREVLHKKGLDQVTRTEFVSQADIAPTLAFLTGRESEKFQGELLFTPRRRPVVADFGPHIYFPALKLNLSRAEVLQASLPRLTAEQQRYRSYYRTFLRWLSGEQGSVASD